MDAVAIPILLYRMSSSIQEVAAPPILNRRRVRSGADSEIHANSIKEWVGNVPFSFLNSTCCFFTEFEMNFIVV